MFDGKGLGFGSWAIWVEGFGASNCYRPTASWLRTIEPLSPLYIIYNIQIVRISTVATVSFYPSIVLESLIKSGVRVRLRFW